jgi:hypothetical protein
MSIYHCPLTKFAGRTPADEDEMNVLRRKAWREDGVLSVKLCDSRLSLSEKKALKQIAERLYGCNREDR